jgi:hypothetical protein
VKLRIEQYVHAGKVNEHTALGMAQRIREELGATLHFAETDPASEEVRKKIARAVTLKVVPLGTWVVVDQLAGKSTFDPSAPVFYQFRDASGTLHEGGTRVCASQGEFLFHKPIACLDSNTAKINTEVAEMARERLLSEPIRVESFEVGEKAVLDPRHWWGRDQKSRANST